MATQKIFVYKIYLLCSMEKCLCCHTWEHLHCVQNTNWFKDFIDQKCLHNIDIVDAMYAQTVFCIIPDNHSAFAKHFGYHNGLRYMFMQFRWLIIFYLYSLKIKLHILKEPEVKYSLLDCSWIIVRKKIQSGCKDTTKNDNEFRS